LWQEVVGVFVRFFIAYFMYIRRQIITILFYIYLNQMSLNGIDWICQSTFIVVNENLLLNEIK
jgi:hypothetical protein